jgi:prepilin-type N-terminal cleavage/methylation domain-containing protein/prepilin-type processing-associated H-X9-DG protein
VYVCIVQRPPKAFTLIELLVAIGIIGVLMSILLPALNKARAAANSVKCLSNLHGIGVAMQIYTAQYHGFLPGSGYTSGRGFFKLSGTTYSTGGVISGSVPSGSPIHSMDWMRPIIDSMAIRVPDAVDNNGNEKTRYQYYMTLSQFTCPSNAGATAVRMPASTSSEDAGTVQTTSYVTAVLFLLAGQDSNGYGSLMRVTPSQPAFPSMPAGYTPNLAKIANSSEKIFMADGGKYINTQNAAPTPQYDIGVNSAAAYAGPANAGYFCSWTDFGSWCICGGAWDRSAAPGNTQRSGSGDPRALIFRHGLFKNGQYRANALFFDGHVESMPELTFSQPRLWMPTGASWSSTGTGIGTGVYARIWPDVISRFNLPANYVVP